MVLSVKLVYPVFRVWQIIGVKGEVAVEEKRLARDVGAREVADDREVDAVVPLDDRLAVGQLVITSHGGEVPDDPRQTDPERVELAGHDAVEPERLCELDPATVGRQFLVSEGEDVESGLAGRVERSVGLEVGVHEVQRVARSQTDVAMDIVGKFLKIATSCMNVDGERPTYKTSNVGNSCLSVYARSVWVGEQFPIYFDKLQTK